MTKSLVVAGTLGQPEARYSLLETISQYALNLLRETIEEGDLHNHHREWYLNLAEQVNTQWRGPNRKKLLDHLEAEIDNLRAANGFDTFEIGLEEGDKDEIPSVNLTICYCNNAGECFGANQPGQG